MLKKLSYLMAIAVLAAAGCTDPDSAPTITFETLGIGAFPFLEELKTAEFDLANLSGSAYEMDVSFIDNAGGNDVAQYNIYVSFNDNNPDNGTITFPSTLFKSFTPSDFAPLGEKGNLGLTVRIPFSEVAAFVGAGAPGAVVSGDRFRFRTEIIKADGTPFSSANSTPAITSSFGGIWNFDVTATCPLPNTAFVGNYRLSYGFVYDQFALFGAPVQALGNPPLDLVVELGLVAGSTTRRTYDVGTTVNPGYMFNAAVSTLEFACDVVRTTPIDSGAGCGTGTIAAVQTGVATFDLNDDTTWTIEFSEYGARDGGCGVAAMNYSLVFTKQ